METEAFATSDQGNASYGLPKASSVHLPEPGSSARQDIEDYVSARMMQTLARVKAAAYEEIRSLRLPNSTTQDIMRVLQRSIEQEFKHEKIQPSQADNGPVYRLRFHHDCQALGCTQTTCDLCESNPRRRCLSDFDRKYFKGDEIKARCGGCIYVEMLDQEGEPMPVDKMASNASIEISVIDGNKFEQLFPQGTPTVDTMHCLESCMIVYGNEGRPLLHSDEKSYNRDNGKILIPIQSPKSSVRDFSIQCSSEALLSGRRPPFRLMARYRCPNAPSNQLVIPAVSTNFIVASGRSRLSQKKSIPFSDDPVSRLENMGKERIKKLSSLRVTAAEMGVEYPSNALCEIRTVSDFKRLAFDADTDGQLKQKLLHMLKMSEKAWEESRDHAACSIDNDTRMRAWYCPEVTDLQGLAYVCYLGETDIHKPVALLTNSTIVLKECLDAEQRNVMQTLQEKAIESWSKPNHPGWSFLHFDSETYKKDHTSLLAIGRLTYEHHSREWPIRKDMEPTTQTAPYPPGSHRVKRLKKNRQLKATALRENSPPSPESRRSPYEFGRLGCEGTLPSTVRDHPRIFEAKDEFRGGHVQTGPIIPRPPPDSAFTRRMEERGNNEAMSGDRSRSQVPDPSLFEQFYITSSANNNNKAISNSGTTDVYTPLKTPFYTRTLDDLLKRQMTQLQCKSDGSEEMTGGIRSGSDESLMCLNHMDRRNDGHPEQLVISKGPNRLSCSIESLPSQCKVAINEEQRIRQMERSGGYSHQDFQQSFEGAVFSQAKKRSESPSRHQERSPVIPVEQTSQVQVQDTLQQLNSGLLSYGFVLVPIGAEQQQDMPPSNGPRQNPRKNG